MQQCCTRARAIAPNFQHVATRRNTVVKRTQHVAICRAEMLQKKKCWPEIANVGPKMLGYIVLICWDRLAGASQNQSSYSS